MLLRLFLTLFVAISISYVLADEAKSCILPPYPEHGTYKTNVPNAEPGKAFDSILLNVTCGPGYDVIGNNNVFCVNGMWSNDLPKCGRICQLNQHPSITYKCIVDNNVQITRKCLDKEPDGTIVIPECNAPNYYSSASLAHMKCIEGSWDYIPVCQAECGRVSPQGEKLLLKRSTPAHRGQMPWHAGVYTKTTKPYKQICGGSLISSKIVISAAHCFWNDLHHLKPASDYAVAVGKEYRSWNDPGESAQKSDVKEIKIPPHFRGSQTNFQDDIAVVFVSTEFEYKVYIRPVCLDFDVNFDMRQLETGRVGKVPTWDYEENDKRLQIVDVKTIDIESCFTKVPASFREYITSDKLCGDILNDKKILRGNGGAGVAVPETDLGTVRYYLRGVVSTAPAMEEGKTYLPLVAFTHILKHKHFIKPHLI